MYTICKGCTDIVPLQCISLCFKTVPCSGHTNITMCNPKVLFTVLMLRDLSVSQRMRHDLFLKLISWFLDSAFAYKFTILHACHLCVFIAVMNTRKMTGALVIRFHHLLPFAEVLKCSPHCW